MPSLFSRFFSNPLQIGSVASSSPWLAKAMLATADLTGCILELGAGTGPITEKILEAAKDQACVEVVEIDLPLAKHLRKRFPTLRIHENDIETVLDGSSQTYSTIFSGIPFAVMEKKKRRRVYEKIRSHLAPCGRFIMFQYSKTTEKELKELFGEQNVTIEFVPLNLPPAFVYTCRKEE